MKRSVFLIASLMLACVRIPAQTVVRVAAAADLEPVLPPIVEQFNQTTAVDNLRPGGGITVQVTYQASAALATQIQNGAPFDLFLSANMDYPQKLIAAGVAQGLGEGSGGTPIKYAEGTLVLWVRNDSKLGPPSLELLRNPQLKKLAIANPERAPYGKAAVAALEKLGLYAALKPKFALAENIAQAAQFVDSGNADAGLISLTSATTQRLASAGHYFEIPADLYPPIEQAAVLVANSSQRVAAKKFLVFLMSAPVQQELREHGLKPARPVP